MAEGRTLRQLLKAGVDANPVEFRRVAQEVIKEERSKKHHLLANDLERILYGESSDQKPARALEVPRDRERTLPLIAIRQGVRDLSDIVLSVENRQVVERVMLEQARADVLGTYGLRPLSRLLFCGPPGCGKTLAAEVLATELGMELATVRFDAVVSSLLGETAANLRQVFDFLESNRVVALFDEFDAIAKEREDVSEHGELKRVVTAFLQMLDGYRGKSLILAATNHERLLDRALWRRFDELMVFEKPTSEQVTELLKMKLRGVRSDIALDDPDLVHLFEGMSHGDVERILVRAIKTMVLHGQEFLNQRHLEESLARERHRLALQGPR
jgi:SpoVK/Ycf46/Vps4 family AAA+-type ATPase